VPTRVLFPMTNLTSSPPKGPQPEQKPPYVQVRIRSSPKIRQVFWCDFPRDAQLPEMWKTRPVVVLSYRNTLHGPCSIIPTSTQPQDGNPWAYKLSSHVDNRMSWAICNQIYTVAPSRLSSVTGKVPRLSPEEFDEILRKLKAWLPRFPDT